MWGKQKSLNALIRVLIMVPVFTACVAWIVARTDPFQPARSKSVTGKPTAPETEPKRETKSQIELADVPASISTNVAPSTIQNALILSQLPLSSIPAILDTFDPDPVASFRELIK